MRSRRAAMLLIALGVLLLQQLPVEAMAPASPDCCALAKACPMSARPSTSAGGDGCNMKRQAGECSIRAACSTGAHSGDPAIWNDALTRPLVLDAAVRLADPAQLRWSRLDSAALAMLRSDSPPTPPPR